MLIAYKKNTYLHLATLAIVALTMWATLSYHSCEAPITQHTSLPDAFMEDVTAIVMDKQGKPSMKIQTPKMIYYNNGDTSKLIDPQLTIYRKSLQPWFITAKHATTIQGTEKINFTEDVVIHHTADLASPTTIIKTPTLSVYPNQQTAETEDVITLIQPSITIKAIGMQADMNSGSIKLLSQTRGEYAPN